MHYTVVCPVHRVCRNRICAQREKDCTHWSVTITWDATINEIMIVQVSPALAKQWRLDKLSTTVYARYYSSSHLVQMLPEGLTCKVFITSVR
jgi:hypothetical protein